MTDHETLDLALEENYQLKTWLAGLLEGCADCEAEARAYAAATSLAHKVVEVTEDVSP